MQYTKKYKFNKPEGTDKFDIAHFNENAEKIETALSSIENGTYYLKKEIPADEDEQIRSIKVGSTSERTGNYSITNGSNPQNQVSRA